MKSIDLLMEELSRTIAEQAEEDGLWVEADSVVEAYLQQEFRRLYSIAGAVVVASMAIPKGDDRNVT